jgi:hypothetical protein
MLKTVLFSFPSGQVSLEFTSNMTAIINTNKFMMKNIWPNT